jgi:hypothetical protein
MKFAVTKSGRLFVVLIGIGLTSQIFSAGQLMDISQIITKADAESILGEKVKDPSPRSGEGKDGYYSKCNYYSVSRGKSLVLRVQLPDGASGIDPQKELELVAASSGPMKTIDGLGDKAELFASGTDNGGVSHVLMLYVEKGNAFVAIGLGGIDDESAALEKMKTIAQRILERL